jgi:hypothetical protein
MVLLDSSLILLLGCLVTGHFKLNFTPWQVIQISGMEIKKQLQQ